MMERMQDDEAPAWFTESQAGDFEIGDDVVVTLHGECPRGRWHGDQEVGVRGTVIGLEGGMGSPDGHNVCVYYYRPLPVKGASGFYTPGELRRFDVWAAIEEMSR